jgi:hypothetical protein
MIAISIVVAFIIGAVIALAAFRMGIEYGIRQSADLSKLMIEILRDSSCPPARPFKVERPERPQ